VSHDSELEALIEEAIQRALETAKKSRLKRDNPYLPFLIKALLPHKKGLHRKHVLTAIETERRARGLPIPHAFEQAVQRRFQDYCAQCDGFDRESSDDLFFYPTRKGSGLWAVYADRAALWLIRNNKP
jgi:hypothetical protein